mgnify:FL=1
MERREKRALAFLLAASLLCLALVGLAAGDPPAERAEALFRAGREEFDRAAAELLAGNGPAELPRGVTEVTLYPAGEGRVQTVEFLCGGWGVGPSTSYWGISHVPSDVLTGFQGAALSGWEPWDGGWLWREAATTAALCAGWSPGGSALRCGSDRSNGAARCAF